MDSTKNKKDIEYRLISIGTKIKMCNDLSGDKNDVIKADLNHLKDEYNELLLMFNTLLNQ